MKGVFEALALSVKLRGRLEVEEAFIDGSFAPAKKGDQKWGKLNVAKGRKSWPSQIATVFLLECTSKVRLHTR